MAERFATTGDDKRDQGTRQGLRWEHSIAHEWRGNDAGDGDERYHRVEELPSTRLERTENVRQAMVVRPA